MIRICEECDLVWDTDLFFPHCPNCVGSTDEIKLDINVNITDTPNVPEDFYPSDLIF